MIGQTLGHYRILEKLGAGGMGEVYRARDSQLSRDVAIKLLPAMFSNDSQRLARFEQEARLLAALNHPNIATIHGLGRADTRQYLVLELVAGQTLTQLTAARPAPIAEVLSIARQIAEALEAAHEKGIIHRDLKPSNVKLTPEGKVKVLDFGLAKAFAPDASGDPAKSPTVTFQSADEGVILGTAAYMSPEQARGKPLDKRTDIWSFGCVLYELLTRRQAFAGETISDALASILKGEPDWSALPAETPANIRVLLRRCLEKDSNRRLHDIADARLEIEDALSGAAPAGATASAGAWAAAPVWQRALPWTLAGIFALAALFASWQWQRAPRRSPAATRRFSVVTNFSGVEAQPSLAPDGRSVAFVSDRDGQHDIWIGLVVGGSLVRITDDPNVEARPRWSPDGAKIAYGRLNEDGLWDIWVVPAFGGTPRKILANARDPAWSPDGRSLAYANLTTNTIWMCEANGSNPRQITQPELRAAHREPAHSHDGRQLAFVRRRAGPFGELTTVEFATGKVRYLTDDGGLLISPAWSPDGEYIYFASSRGGATNIWRISQGGGMPEQVTAGQGDDAEPDISADGKRIVFSTYRMNANLAELTLDAKDATKLKWLTSDSARMEVAPAYSPDGKRIAYFTARRGAEGEFIWVMNADGSDPVQIAGEERGTSIFPRWSRDGQRLVFSFRARRGFGAEEIRRVGLEGGMPEKLGVMDARDSFGGVGPGDRYAYLGTDGETHVLDPASKQDQKLEGIRGSVPRWSPDGRAVAYIVFARRQGDGQAGLWLYEFGKPPRQVYRGWVTWYGWAGPDEFLLIEGKPDLKAVLWRVRRDGTLPVRILSVRMLYPYYAWLPTQRFDIHPDGKRVAIEALELREADIGMIESFD